MAVVEHEITYRCSDDCLMSGCPGHQADITYWSVSDSYTIHLNGRKIELERGELEALLKIVALLAEDRCDAVQPIEMLSQHLKTRDWVPPAELYKLLPSTYYMDPPDGGNVSLLEQLQRMAEDAAKYRDLCK